ncbi:hypothetical protein KDL45_01360 [bacterium]|nr:hypothetical protein [bacterium]MCB9476942.1 hypothetical protein [Deltaproteobacteria bacterium]
MSKLRSRNRQRLTPRKSKTIFVELYRSIDLVGAALIFRIGKPKNIVDSWLVIVAKGGKFVDSAAPASSACRSVVQIINAKGFIS